MPSAAPVGQRKSIASRANDDLISHVGHRDHTRHMEPLVKPPIVDVDANNERLDNRELTAIALSIMDGFPKWTEPLETRARLLKPMPGSRFEDDDRMKPTDPPSQQVTGLLRSALDHLQMVSDAMAASGPRALASFTLLRSALEASALAAWLMLPGTKDARLRNSIRLSIENRKDAETFNKRWELDTDVGKWFIAEMTATKNQRPGTKDMDLSKNFPTLTSIINDTDKKQRWTGLRGLDAWRACSGFAHSNMQFAGATLMEVTDGKSVANTLRPTIFMAMLEPTKQYFEFSLGLAEKHRAPPPPARQ